MRIREFAAQKLGDAIEERVQLGQPVTIIDAPPSQIAEYPALAVWIERSILDLTQASPVLQAEDGTFLLGSATTDENGCLVPGTTFVQGGQWLSSMGTIRCTGRIWAGARYPSKREELEESVWFAFLQGTAAPGKLALDVTGYKLGKITVPFGTGAAFIKQSQWIGEYSFEARLWSWTMFDLDLPLLVPQNSPLAQQIILEFSKRIDIEIDEPADKANLPDLERYLIHSDGSYEPTIL